ncbi:polyprenyl synthetase family protein [Streptomyces sp. ISL-86]|uniref:polyprenyl synthetase family protein n=1 Tax=Streptomyces sp. ISL-86 TaxID=2819187 RepID=UPI001BED1268|nr:polyprenyl synthetase family protein [Streptomyces sp. ISL-86]MBT2458322.1 polyprenyl synthetase family protein [Streptomyces sp. ISL-86]
MTAPQFSLATPELDLSAIRCAVDTCLERFLECKAHAAARQGMPPEVAATLHDFVFAGGKRLRPLLCVCGWYAAGGSGKPDAVVQAAAALEMFHAFALIHDDLMDHSDTRRGSPTVHRSLAEHHRPAWGRAAAERLGASGAILVGDLALAWSDELLHTASLPPGRLAAVLPIIDTMRSEVMYGQYLDLLATGRPSGDVTIPMRIIRYKTAKYTVERPLHVGAAIAGAGSGTLDTLSAYALPLGEAFQMRDDLLGVYGDPVQTGKSCLEDLREGKHTVLLALALQRADPAQRTALHAVIGDPLLGEDAVTRMRDLITATSAHAAVEDMIRARREQAGQALRTAPLAPAAARSLQQIADTATVRTA